MSPRLLASALTTTTVCIILVLAALLAGCGGGDFEEPETVATKPATPNCLQAGVCT